MNSKIATFEIFTPQLLDEYLEQGWFRMHQKIFTTHFLTFGGKFFSAIWLRVCLKEIFFGKKQKELYRQNSFFTVEIEKAVITPQHANLFKLYRESLSFDISENLHDLLCAKDKENIFNTLVINLYHNNVLVAAGYFDLANTSAAGICTFYHPEYKKYSLGRYLIFLKMDYCKNAGIQYFYPGYIAPGYAAFDYKLSIGKKGLEYLDIKNKQWYSINFFDVENTPLAIMEKKLHLLKDTLEEVNVFCQLHYYQYFDMDLNNTDSPLSLNLLHCPVFLTCPSLSRKPGEIIYLYNFYLQTFELVQCNVLADFVSYNQSETVFISNFLKPTKLIFSTPEIEDIVALTHILTSVWN